MSKGQNVDWDKTPNRPNVESKKRRMGHNVEWDKTPNRPNVESKKSRRGHNGSNGTKRRMEIMSIVRKAHWDKMSTSTKKCRK
jgi:hypothetical protein